MQAFNHLAQIIPLNPACEDRFTYKSFLEGDEVGSTDTCGHGTHAAGLLPKVSPNANVLVQRITKGKYFNPSIITKVGSLAMNPNPEDDNTDAQVNVGD